MSGQIMGKCGTETPHTGIGSCFKKEGKTVGLILTAVNAFYDVDADSFKEKLKDYVGDKGYLRMFPLKDVIANSPNGGDVNAPEAGFGGPRPTNLNAFNEVYQVDGGDCLYKELAKLNKRKMRVFRIDDEGYIFGTIVKKGDKEYFAGFECSVYASMAKGDGSTDTAINIGAWYTANYERELMNKHGFETEEIPEGLIGVTLKKSEDGIRVIATCDGDDYTSMFGSEWKTDMFVDDKGKNPESVTYDEGKATLTITPAGLYSVAHASVLINGDIYGIEGVDKKVEV